jgi:hypothetical protein
VQPGHNQPLLKDWRVYAFGAGCLAVGLVIGAAFYGKVWKLPPAWGDIPTWILALGAIVGSFYAVRAFTAQSQQVRDGAELAKQQAQLLKVQSDQLETQRTQLAEQRALNEEQTKVLKLQAEELSESLKERKEEAVRNVRRDELVARQLAEAEDREKSWRRRLAEEVAVLSTSGLGQVVNNSQRPITDITCKVMSEIDRHTLRLAKKSGDLIPFELVGGPMPMPDTKDYDRVTVVRGGSSCGFTFEIDRWDPDMVLVIWFTDDEGHRWQLDQYGHLVESPDESEYVA